MRFLSQLSLLLVLCVSSWALHESDVGIVDWHKKLIGVPLSGSILTAPTFHATGNTTVVITATDNNVLAVLNPEDGSVHEFPYYPILLNCYRSVEAHFQP